ncbi:MAG: hypothetical protein QOJ52_1347 [Acidimicrobiaceae bacterium]|jgi:hypothetical protein|nr:hypothetical protein [Acidimicrobiaceae bacterium]MDQ1376413.1 hypothetical protein [Acidimicrobiaceae bacterium]MDQ1399133.1 hypothetical protein [Acidimicrobiaceae bacterium]MDQ1413728.1 hypothetical protein [Acidimicrobiaceae bacterium]MDQ1417427.1 hypothetical protein [Acidimicrobiaceae bacterium]
MATTTIWYCSTCGYEVAGRGGKCHNCKEPLVQSPLEQLAEGEVEDEVGYNLDEWEDVARGELIEALNASGFRHRFEGDELVVAAEDEDDVDHLIANLGADHEHGDPTDMVPGEVLTRLADAARRLELDPTDMIADGDLAEAAAGVFAIDVVWGVDDETWAAIGRVTRRLLGALGADEALEEEISESATLLSRMLRDLEGVVPGFGEPPDQPADTAATAGGDVDAEVVGDAGSADDDEEGDDEEQASGQEDEMVYELEDWRPEERAHISLMLERGQIAYHWEGSDLVVGAAHDEAVEAILAEVSRTGSDGTAEADDETRYLLLSDLFGAADRLAGDPEHEQKQEDVVMLATMIQSWATPFAVSDDEWWKIRLRASDLAESIGQHASRAVVEDGAVNLRDLLRKFV